MTKCKLCLLRDIAGKEDVYAQLLKMKELMPQKEKASDAEYEQRLSICHECDFFLAATCRKCGCYVELRALSAAAHCPAKRW